MQTLITRGTFDHPADFVTWEVEYNDGTTARESEGSTYNNIDRENIKRFSLISSDGVSLFDLYMPIGASGKNLIFRRRTAATGQVRNVLFILGYEPMGPVFAINVVTGEWRSLEHFTVGDPDLYPPELLEFERA